MDLDDRDYMRERYRARKGLQWNERKGRVEGTWFDPVNQGHDYQRGRYRPGAPRTGGALRWIPFVLSLLISAIPAYYGLKREGWFPDPRPGLPFPPTGSVTVSAGVSPKTATSRLIVITANANAVVQLFYPASGRHVISVYVAKNDKATVPVPPGTYRMKIVEGQRWHGPKKFFGASTTYETAVELVSFRPQAGFGIDLNRRPDGNLPTRPNWREPDPL